MAGKSAGSVIRIREHFVGAPPARLARSRGNPMAQTDPPPPRRAIRELPVAERPRERMATSGPQALSGPELLSVLWGTGRPGVSAYELASDVLARHGSLAELARADHLELARLPGIGTARAAQLVAAFELGR